MSNLMRLTIKADGEVRDANGNLKRTEPVELTGLFTEEEIAQLQHLINVKKEQS
jgi:hypothetical protein